MTNSLLVVCGTHGAVQEAVGSDKYIIKCRVGSNPARSI